MANVQDPLWAFLEASVWHGSLDESESILSAHPDVGKASIHAAAILGDDATVGQFLALDPANATAKGGPHGWDALTHLCFSKYLRLERARTDGFVRAATALLDAGADARTGFFDESHRPQPAFESALYGAAGVAHHPELTRLLLERGADANDGEVVYHAPEGWDNRVLEILVEHGKVTGDGLATMLLRKADWHDLDGIKFLLAHGADPNRLTHWGFARLHQAVRRDNAIENIQEMLDAGAKPNLAARDGGSAFSLAARRGRGDLLTLFEQRGFPIALHGVERLMAACARNDPTAIRSIAAQEPQLVDQLKAEGGKRLAEFAGNGNTDGVRQLLDLGVGIDARFEEGDGYFDIAESSTALHVAAWRARHATVKFLIERGAPLNIADGQGRSPLALAVRACVDSYWTERRSPESVRTLLQAGASVAGVPFPSGYAEVDQLIESHGRIT